jgi:hypothetical protein
MGAWTEAAALVRVSEWAAELEWELVMGSESVKVLEWVKASA